ncbi:MAG: hypothetical protein HUJ61_06815 [Bacilli bacterium]|nr:hypothetical protein [Bacilli bacterium]
MNKISELARISSTSSLKDFTTKVIEIFDMYNKFITVGDVSNNIELLNYYIDLAAQMDDMDYSLEDYSLFYQELDRYELDPEFQGSGTSTNAVKLMSIHASKGLQFKVVYYAGLSKKFMDGSKGNMRFDKDYGICLPNIDYVHPESFYKDFISKKDKIDTINEQLRVFYVALTRAEEKAILINRLDYKKNIPTKFEKMNSYLDFYNFSEVNFEFTELEPLMEREEKLDDAEKVDEQTRLDIKLPYNFDKTTISKSKASKDKTEDVDTKALELGNLYHYYLELTDFGNKDTSFIKDLKHKEIIDTFLRNPIFKNSDKAKVCHEYSFFDEEAHKNGVIDLLLVYDDHIDIVDFKLSHVDDEAYDTQVGIYKDYIRKIAPNKQINTYVLGIISGAVREVK